VRSHAAASQVNSSLALEVFAAPVDGSLAVLGPAVAAHCFWQSRRHVNCCRSCCWDQAFCLVP